MEGGREGGREGRGRREGGREGGRERERGERVDKGSMIATINTAWDY